MPNVLVLGCGAVGLYYGGRLLESGQVNVKFLFRNFVDSVKENGFDISSPDGNAVFTKEMLKSRIIYIQEDININDIFDGECVDWIVVALKSTSISDDIQGDCIRQLISKYLHSRTRILVIMNGLAVEQTFGEWFGNHRVFGGMAFICVNRQECRRKLVINHIFAGSLLIGHLEDNADDLVQAKALWESTILANKVTLASSLLQARWSKLAWNLPFTGLSVALGGVTTDVIAKDSSLRRLADMIMLETISLANCDIQYHHKQKNLTRTSDGHLYDLPSPPLIDAATIRPFCWHLTDNMGPYKTSTAIDLVQGNNLEIEFMFNKPYQRALFLSTLPSSSSSSGDAETNEGATSQSEDVPSAFPSEPSPCKWPHLEHVVLQVQAVQRIAEMKKSQDPNFRWLPTLFNE